MPKTKNSRGITTRRTLEALRHIAGLRNGLTATELAAYMRVEGFPICARTARRDADLLTELGLIRKQGTPSRYIRGVFRITFEIED
jgi:repressor of nif and glnA expression